MINPSVVEGQIAGGTVQGIGGVLLEHLVYDELGNPLATTFMDYLLPTTTDVPVIEYCHVSLGRSDCPWPSGSSVMTRLPREASWRANRQMEAFTGHRIVKAFGKQDLEGAQQAWEQVIQLAPDSAEGQAAKRALDSLRSAHSAGGQKPGA